MPVNIQLDNTQIMKLWEALLVAYTQPGQFEQMLFFRTGKQIALIVPPNANLSDSVFRVIMEAQRENWIVDLIKGAHEHNPAQPQLREFVAESLPQVLISLGESGEGGDNPLTASFLSEDRGRVFINREQLRDGLRELTASGVTPCVLTIHSDIDRCGKTYSTEFIKYLALRREERVAYIDLRQDISLGEGLKELIEQLGRKVQADIATIPAQEAQTARWTRNLVFWLIDHINRSGDFWWLVFDSINQVDGLPSEIHDFIARLVRQLEIEEFDPPCRLVLISYEGREQLPLDLRHRVVQDVINEEIGPGEMQAFFKEQIHRLLGMDEDGDPAPGVDTAATALYETVQARLDELPQETRPYAISGVVRDALRELEASLVQEEEETP